MSRIGSKIKISALAAGLCLMGTLASSQPSTAAAATTSATEPCAYSAHSIAELSAYSRLIGRTVNCAIVFNDASSNWSQWVSPWFLGHSQPDLDWTTWKNNDPQRQLVITQNLFPSSENQADWLTAGAAGRYTPYARQLAGNLIRAGLGESFIRLGHEANGTWYSDSVPNDAKGQAQWRTFWDNTVLAMRSVPGAHFKFVWNVSYKVRNLSLTSFYPGDLFVDVVALDAYDSGPAQHGGRFPILYNESGGIYDVLTFAKAHKKPFAIPEWGLVADTPYARGGGNDPSYIDGIASVVRQSGALFQGYWYAHANDMALINNSPASLTALRVAFGGA